MFGLTKKLDLIRSMQIRSTARKSRNFHKYRQIHRVPKVEHSSSTLRNEHADIDEALSKAREQAYTAEKMFRFRLFWSTFCGSCKIQVSNSFPFGISGQNPLQSDMKSRIGFSKFRHVFTIRRVSGNAKSLLHRAAEWLGRGA